MFTGRRPWCWVIAFEWPWSGIFAWIIPVLIILALAASAIAGVWFATSRGGPVSW